MNYNRISDFDSVVTRLLDRLPPNIDKRVRSVAYAILSAPAMEFAINYEATLEIERNLSYLTASGGWLDLHAVNTGTERRTATAARLLCITTNNIGEPMVIPFNTRFITVDSDDVLRYILEYYTDEDKGECIIRCETVGEIGNIPSSVRLSPLSYIPNFGQITISSIYKLADEIESDEDLRRRIGILKQSKGSFGNLYFWQEILKDDPATKDLIGQVAPIPKLRGQIYATLMVVDPSFQPVSLQTRRIIKEIADPDIHIGSAGMPFDTTQGMGVGYAPIGQYIQVVTPNIKNVSMNMTVKAMGGATIIANQIYNQLLNYIDRIKREWGKLEIAPNDVNYLYRPIGIFRSAIISEIMIIDGMRSVELSNFLINGAPYDINIIADITNMQQEYRVPRLGQVIINFPSSTGVGAGQTIILGYDIDDNAIAPEVNTIIPTRNATNVSINTSLEIEFTVELDPTIIGMVILGVDDAAIIFNTIQVDGKFVKCFFDTPLEYNMVYRYIKIDGFGSLYKTPRRNKDGHLIDINDEVIIGDDHLPLRNINDPRVTREPVMQIKYIDQYYNFQTEEEPI